MNEQARPSRLLAMLRFRCPHCLRGPVFAGLWRMYTHCPVCGIRYERESGYFMNSIFIGYVLAFLILVPLMLVLYFRQVSTTTFLIYVSVVVAIVSPFVFRYARVVWMHMDELMDPRPATGAERENRARLPLPIIICHPSLRFRYVRLIRSAHHDAKPKPRSNRPLDVARGKKTMATMLPEAIPTLSQGFILYASLIIAFGPQNIFVLRQGLRRQHLFVTAFLCTAADLFLTSIGVGGLGTVIATTPTLSTLSALGGAAFLIGCGVRSFYSAWRQRKFPSQAINNAHCASLQHTVLAALGFSFLNPAAYVDTLLMLGTASSRYPADERLLFGLGAILASGLWFFTLAYGASRFTPLFSRPGAWRMLDVLSGCFMFAVAGSMCAPHFVGLW